MPEPSQGTAIILAIKEQADVDTPASGAGATQIEVLPSPGANRNAATIDSALISPIGMKRKSRQGSLSATSSYDVELINGALQTVYAGVLGGTVTAAFTVDQATLTSVAIATVASITTITFGGGSAITAGIRAGMVFYFTGLTGTASNNNKNVPVLGVTSATAITVPSGILTDAGADATFVMHVYKSYATPNPRLAKYYTIEAYLSDLASPESILATSFKFTGLTINAQPNAPVKATFTLSGVNVEPFDASVNPNFTTPTNDAVAGHDPIIGLDGALYIDGKAPVFSVSGLQMGLQANATSTPLLFSRTPAGVGLAQFGVSGQITGLVTDLAAMQSSVDDDQISLFAWFKDLQGGFESIYMGNASYGSVSIPIAEMDEIQTLPLYGGRDTRGAGYLESTWVISTSAT